MKKKSVVTSKEESVWWPVKKSVVTSEEECGGQFEMLVD